MNLAWNANYDALPLEYTTWKTITLAINSSTRNINNMNINVLGNAITIFFNALRWDFITENSQQFQFTIFHINSVWLDPRVPSVKNKSYTIRYVKNYIIHYMTKSIEHDTLGNVNSGFLLGRTIYRIELTKTVIRPDK